MSQKLTPGNSQKGFAVGRGLLAAAETLNFSMAESLPDSYGSSSQHGGLMGLGGVDSQDSQQTPRRMNNPLSNTMKLFASLGLSPNDLDALAQVPEESISVETLPKLIMQLKNRKAEAGQHVSGDLLSQSHSPDPSYRGVHDEWGDGQGGRPNRSTTSTSQSRTSQSDFGYSSSQDLSSRSYDMLDYGSGGSSRDRQYSDLSTDRYCGLGMTSSSTPDLFMQRRMGSPSHGKIQDFFGAMPPMFPHVCSLCEFDVHSSMEWTEHTTGIRHTENRRLLLQLYPEWDPQMPSGRMSDSLPLRRSDGILGAAPSSMRERTNWDSTSSMSMSSKSSYSATPKIRSRVVVVKYDEKPKLSALFALASRFGSIREHLVLKNKAFLELMTHEQAVAMTNHYLYKPTTLHGRSVKIYLSKELLVIEKGDRQDRESRNPTNSQVVFFSNLPRETEKKAELLTLASRFGTVVNHLFLNDQAFIQMSNSEDAEMLVKYYTIHPLTISRRTIRMNICTKYKTLTVVPGKGEQVKEPREESDHSSSRTSSKSSSKPQRSASSRAKESSSKKAQDPKPKEKEKEAGTEAGSSEDGQGVVQAHAEKEEARGENSVTEQQDQETAMEMEDSALEAGEKEGDKHDDDAEITEEQKNVAEESAEPNEHEEQEDNSERKETDEQDDVEQGEGAADDSVEQEEDLPEESDIPEDLDEFVTLDELAEDDEADQNDSRSRGRSRDSGGMRVVNVVGFKRGYGYLDEILALAQPFGKVVRHLDLHSRPEVFLEFSDEQEARSMVRFYNGNVIPSVCGKTVKIYHSMTYATIQSGRVVYIGHIPPFKSSNASFLKVAEPFGKIRRYFLNRSRCECFIEMVRGEDAERFVESTRQKPLVFEGKRLLVYISRKYKQLRYGHKPPTSEEKRPTKREHSEEREESSPSRSTTNEEEPPSKKSKEKSSEENAESEALEEKEVTADACEHVEDVKKELTDESNTDTTETQNVALKSPEDEADIDIPPTESSSVASSTGVPETSQELTDAPPPPAESVRRPETTLESLGPYEPNVPVGVEFVKMGYYCRVCFLFYSNEDTAKKVHCSSHVHYEKLKKQLEKEKAKAQSNRENN